MLRTMAEPLGEVCSVTRRLLRRGLGLQTSRCVNVFFPAKGGIFFEQATYMQRINFSYLGASSLYKIFLNAFDGQPPLPANYLNVVIIFAGNLREPHEPLWGHSCCVSSLRGQEQLYSLSLFFGIMPPTARIIVPYITY